VTSSQRPFRAAFLTWPALGPARFDTAFEARAVRERPLLRLALDGWFAGGGGTCFVVPFRAGLPELAEVDVDVVCFPELAGYAADGEAWHGAQLEMFAACESAGDRMAIVDPPPNLGVQEVCDWRAHISRTDTAFGALYYPWLRVAAPNGELVTVPPCGHVAAAWSRSPSSAGNVVLEGVLDIAVDLTVSEVDRLTAAGINPLRAMAGWGIRTWGVRTLAPEPDRTIAKARLKTALKRASNSYQH
jgi:phage tail sheath protein FI